jgi:hypothetical protein
MSSVSDQPDDRTPDDLPSALARDVRSLYAPDVRVPESIDASILADARAGFARRRRFRLAVRGALLGAGAAAAAVVVLALRIGGAGGESPNRPVAQQRGAVQPATSPTALAGAGGASVVEDVDYSGRVDILDAFVVAKLVELQDHLDNPAYDVNGDGAVDRSDVDRIAMAAVDTTAPRRGDEGRVQ